MAGLQGQTVQSTYDGLLKTIDNQPLNGTLKALTDGNGNQMKMEASTSGVAFTGNADFTDATVIGLTSGTSGTSGVNGTSGTPGTSGTSGLSGSAGTSGTSGTSGAAGAPGTSGTSGANGTSGTSGAAGTSGTPGTSGTSGSSGTSNGTSGTSGTSGATGTSGTSGSSGISGGGSGEVMFPEQFLSLQGYSPQFGNYFLLSQPVVGQISFSAAIDVNSSRFMMAPLYVQPGVTIPYIFFKIINIVGADSYEWAIYNTYTNGRPKDRIYYSTFSVDSAGGADQWIGRGADTVNFTESFYWIAIKPRTGFGLNSNLGAFNRANVVTRLATTLTGPDLYPIGMLQFNSAGLPTSFTSTELFNHRDESFVVGLSLGPV